MKPEILEYIQNQRVGVLALEMLDGSPHAAAVHYAHSENPVEFYFGTHLSTRKAEPFKTQQSTRASFVIGTDESSMKTFQLNGIVEIIKSEEKQKFLDIYLQRFPDKKERTEDEKFLAIKFTPTWWRYTDMKHPSGTLIISSD